MQAELWDNKKYYIAVYPTCIINRGFYHIGDKCRIAIMALDKQDAILIYKRLKSGEWHYSDYISRMYNGWKDAELIGIKRKNKKR